MRKPGPRALLIGAVAALVVAIAGLGGRENFATTLLYASCTLLVVCCATGVTIALAARFGKGRSNGDLPGAIEIGFLIGFFAVSPMALSGAFTILDALSRQ